VVVNHGVLSPITRLEKASVKEWKEHFDVNFFSSLALVQETIPHLRASKGRILFTSSGAAIGAYTAWGAYGASKAALNSLARHVAVEEPDIVSLIISPGRVDTDMQREIREKGDPGIAMAEKDYAGFKKAFEQGTLNQPELPGLVMAKLILEAKPELSGKYLV
jgi:NAD(P)-dependent dehydrogenase (short-subunit alcohol dehydrogenase family)